MKNLIMASFFLLFATCSPPPEQSDTASQTIDSSLDPIQTKVDEDSFDVNRGDYKFKIKPLAEYEIHAQVKSKRTYGSDWTSLLSPIDLALAWGGLVAPNADEHISYSQSNRWYYYKYDGASPFQKPYIRSHSANHHILPASENVERAVYSLGVKEKVRLQGFLVKVNGTDSSGKAVWWKSSLSRNDEGDGSCEVFWVKEVQIGDKVYR